LNDEVFKIEDLDLMDNEIKDLHKLFEANDVLPDLDCDRNEDDSDDLMGFDGDCDYDF
jgi:hypothetical protein